MKPTFNCKLCDQPIRMSVIFTNADCDHFECNLCHIYEAYVLRTSYEIAVEWMSRYGYLTLRFVPPNSFYLAKEVVAKPGLTVYDDWKEVMHLDVPELTPVLAKKWRQKLETLRVFQ